MKISKTLLAIILTAAPLSAETPPALSASRPLQGSEEGAAEAVTIRMKDGSTLRARIVLEDDDRLRIVTLGGVAMDLPRTSVQDIQRGATADAGPRPLDSNDTRLLFSPTGRPLPKGAGYFSDHLLVFPGVAYGITDNVSVGGGVSVIPGLGLGEQLFYVAPRVGKRFSDDLAASAGLLYARGGEDGDHSDLGVGFGMATWGQPDHSLTFGGGVARTVEHDSYPRFVNGRPVYEDRVSHTPLVIFGGTARLSRRIALVSENWLVLHDDFKLSEQPFGIGLRFLGERLSADVGVILVGELLDEGFPLPWVSVTYHLDRKK